MLAKPFHIYDKRFLDILGSDPTFQLISENTVSLAHEAAVWQGPSSCAFSSSRAVISREADRYSLASSRIPATDDVFFAQNAGGGSSGTGIDKSNVISVINLKDVANLANGTLINATTVPITPGLEMTNGQCARLCARLGA
jgi:gluconolactonase